MNRVILLSAAVFFGACCSAQNGWVVVPVSEYENLRHKAYPIDPQPGPTPVEATLTRVEYESAESHSPMVAASAARFEAVFES